MARSQKQTFDSTAGGPGLIPGQETKTPASHEAKKPKRTNKPNQNKKKTLLSEKINYRMMPDTVS